MPTVHEQLRQHILEAELGSAITISFAKKPAIPLPGKHNEAILIDQLQASDKTLRWQAAEKLSYSANTEVVLALITAMNDSSGTQRVCVMAQALGHIKDPRSLSALTQAAFDPYNRDLRLCAIRSIGMIGDKSAVPDLIKALQQNNTPVQTANSLARLGDVRAVQPLIDAASNQSIRPWMIRALGELGKKEALPYLNAELASVTTNIKMHKILEESLWKISILDQLDNTTALSEVLLDNHESNKRMWAAYRLGELKNVMSVYQLISSLHDDNIEVAGRAAAALVRMKEVSLMPIRLTLMQSVRPTAKANHQSQFNYLYAVLGYIGDTTDITILQSVSDDKKVFDMVVSESLELIKSGI